VEVRYQFLFELKFSKKKDGQKGLEAKRIEGINQIKGYHALEDIKRLSKLQSYVLLTDGTEMEAVAVCGAG
ncbi:MAG: AAA family ATPase, partial [Candidatus Electrothrix sp. AX5]|nr:AAA family ATPase [Candidatus Electrothrix sp. AX5]